jgi:ABC-type multidrug transport system fused ATPase/permease subunit
MALVTNPDILLLDEPLSGLSSADVMEIVKLLRMLADNSKVVFCSLHQPDYNVFLAFDKILFIDEEGYCIFFGKPTECFEYFRNQTDNISLSTLPEICKNPAVLFKLVESRKHYDNMAYQRKFTPSELYQNFLKNNKLENKAVYNKIKVFHNKKFCKTLRNFIKLIFISDLKNYKRSYALFFTVLFCGIIFSALLSSPKQFYYNDNFPIWIFVIQLSSVFIGMMISVHEGFYIYEYLKFLRRILKFHNAEALTLLIKYFLISFILSLVLVFPGSLIMKCEFYGMKLFLWIWILMLWGAFAGILISKLSKNLVVAFVLIPFIIMPQIILSGAFVRYDKLNLFSTKASSDVPYIADLVPLRWSLEAITADFYMNNPYGKIITPFSSQIKLNNFKIKNFYILNSNDSEISGEKKKNDFNNVFTDKLQKENNILINLIDSEFRKYENIDFIRKKYSNIGIDRIIRNYETIDNTNIENFPRIFHKDVEFVNNRVFLNGYKYFVGMIINTFNYNFLVMFFYVFIMFLAIYILLKTEKI